MISERSGTVWYRRPDFWFWFIAAAGLIFRLEYLREFAAFDHFNSAVGPDVRDYHNRALGIVNGVIFPDTPDIHAPLYGFFLAFIYKITGAVPGVARVIQLLLNWGAWIALAILLQRLGAKLRTVLTFLILAMFTPVLIFHQAELISESLIVVIFCICAWLLYRADRESWRLRWRYFAGVAAGFAVLNHGLMWAFAAAETLYALQQRQWKRAALFFCGVLTAVLPFIAVKSIYYGHFVSLQKNAMFNIWLGHNPSADGGCWLRPGRAWNEEHRTAAVEAASRNISVDRLYLERMVNFYRDEPAAALKLLFKKACKLISPAESISGADSTAMIYKTPLQYYLRSIALIIVVSTLGGIVLLFVKPPENAKQFIHFYLLAAAVAVMHLLTVSSGRYRMGMMPGVILLAALALSALPLKRLVVVLTALIAVHSMILLAVPRRDYEEAALMGEAHFNCGNYDASEKALEFASRGVDNPEFIDNLLGIIAEKRGDLVLAEKFYRQALSKYDPQAHFNLGLMLSKNFPARLNEATALLKSGIKIDPTRPDVWNQIGVNSVYMKQPGVAHKAFEAAVQLAPMHPGYRKNLEFINARFRKTEL